MIRCAERFDSARVKFFFKIREQLRQSGRRFDLPKFRARLKNPGHLREIVVVVRAQINHATRGERGLGDFRKLFIDEPVFVVPFLRPRVREINVQRGHRLGWQQIGQKIRRLDAHAAQVRQPGTAAFAIQFAQAAEQPFHADEIALRM